MDVHTAAIAAGSSTIAVIETPLDHFWPSENRSLQEQLTREHLVVSQFPSGYPVKPQNFPIRNCTVALCPDAIVIIEAGETSGTVHQGWEALRLGRFPFLLESVANDCRLSWLEKMILRRADRARDHSESLSISPSLLRPRKVLLIDDFVTRRATLLGAASRAHTELPEVKIRGFALVRSITDGESRRRPYPKFLSD